MHHLAQLLGVCGNGRATRIQFGFNGHGGVFDAVQIKHIGHQRIQIQCLQLRSRQAGVVAELVDEPLHGIDLINDGSNRLGQDGLFWRWQLAGKLHFKALGRQLNGRERVLDFMGQAPRHLTPGLGSLGGNNFRNIVKNQQPCRIRKLGTPHHQAGCMVRRSTGGTVQLKRLLPVVQAVVVAIAQEIVKLFLYRSGKCGQARHRRQRFARIGRHGGPQNARGAGIERQDEALRVQHHHAGSEVVQNGLQLGPRSIDRAHALRYRTLRVRNLLCHGGKGTGEPVKFIPALQGGLGAEIAGRHLPHPLGQHQQRPHQLIAQQHRQQHRAKHRQKQAQRQRAHIHAAQALAGQGTLLVLPIGLLHRQSIGHQGRGQGHRDLQKTWLQQQPYTGAGDQRKHLHSGILGCGRVGDVVQTLDLGQGALLAHHAQLG